MANDSDLWFEFTKAGLCGLCGNWGVLDTRSIAISPAGVDVGGVHFCICPNGRKMKEIGYLPTEVLATKETQLHRLSGDIFNAAGRA